MEPQSQSTVTHNCYIKAKFNYVNMHFSVKFKSQLGCLVLDTKKLWNGKTNVCSKVL